MSSNLISDTKAERCILRVPLFLFLFGFAMAKEYYYITPCGVLNITIEQEAVCSCLWADVPVGECLGGKLKQLLDKYFATGKMPCDVPVKPQGTDFQKSVWRTLMQVAAGSTVSYSQLAAMCGRPKAARAVANALHRNPIHVFVPCHRVVGANGSLTGYAAGLERKAFLLELEGAMQSLLRYRD